VLFCIESHTFYILDGVVPFDTDYQAMCHRRLNLERESGMHYDIRAMNRANG
jgi:hypothetical protein